MVTIADVAARAEVGSATVSRVLNDNPRVHPETRARVLAAIEELGYRPNPMARALSRGECQTIGVVVPFFTQPSAVERVRGVAAALDGSAYDLVLFNVESPEHRDTQFASLVTRGWADGLLVLTVPPPPAALRRLRSASVPVALVDVRAEGHTCVVTDDVEGGRIATRHLVELGHEHIAFLGDVDEEAFGFVSSARREQGFHEVLDHAGVTGPRLVAHGHHDVEVARTATEQLLDHRPRPTAVFAASDVQALGVVAAARHRGLRIPHDLSVIGFDDVDLARHTDLTTVRQPLFDSGHLGARLLIEALADRHAPEARVHELPLELVERSTTGPPPPRRGRSRPTGGTP